MKYLVILLVIMLCGCQHAVLYDVSGENHTDYEVSMTAKLENGHHVWLAMDAGSSGGNQVTIVPGVPKTGRVGLKKTILTSKPGAKYEDMRWFSSYYYHDVRLPEVPPLFGNRGVVLVFHAYECHVEVDVLPQYFDESLVPPEMVRNDYMGQWSDGKISRRLPTFHPQCPPYDGNSYRIDLNGGYTIIGDKNKDDADFVFL